MAGLGFRSAARRRQPSSWISSDADVDVDLGQADGVMRRVGGSTGYRGAVVPEFLWWCSGVV
jgi:hypothetical protein